MKDDIAQLREIQIIDLEISKLDEEITSGDADLAQRRAGIEARQEAIEQMRLKVAAAEQRRGELEAELAEIEQRITDRQAKLMSVQTNREYQSLLKESEDAKKAGKEREEEIVLLMEQIEALTARIDEEGKVCASEKQLLAEAEEKVEKRAAKLKTERNKAVKNRDGKAAAVPAALIKKYDLLRERRNGLAVIEVTSGVCRGCFMNIPPQLYNELMKEDRLLCCPTCHRIMFHQPETETA